MDSYTVLKQNWFPVGQTNFLAFVLWVWYNLLNKRE